MIDHVLGRPSIKFRKYQVFAVLFFWTLYLRRGNRHGPPFLRRISRFFSARFTTWQTLVLTLLYLYVSKNFGKLAGLESPEPLANLYTRSYFRATWVTTALDAGFWTAMHLRPKWLKDVASVAFTLYYLIFAEQADEKVRQVRGGLTLQHLRISWNKPNNPLIHMFTTLSRPKKMQHRYPPREIRIQRPRQSAYKEPVHAWLYFDGPLSALKNHDKVILDVPGGGFVAMDPRCHDDKLFAWSGRSGLPLLALDYRKAPEYPYPYAMNECYDVYHMLVATRGQCIGFTGEFTPKIVVSGDSAGANLAVGMVLMILQSGSTDSRRWHGETALPPPDGLVLVYPALDMNIGNWMTDEQMALIKDRRMRKTNRGVLRRKSDDYRKLDPETPQASEDEDESSSPSGKGKAKTGSKQGRTQVQPSAAHTIDTAAAMADTKPTPYKTRLAMSSMLSYFNDRILTPEMMRAMIVLYIGPHSRPDFSSDFYLSPLLAPEAMLARFPKTYMLTGERDPLVDDTVIFAGRLRQAKLGVWRERKELGLVRESEQFDESRHVNVMLVPGISHGFLQFVSVYPEGWKHILRARRWMIELFREAELREQAELADYSGRTSPELTRQSDARRWATTRHGEIEVDVGVVSPDDSRPGSSHTTNRRHHVRSRTASSGDEDRPLEMSSLLSSSTSTPKTSKPGSSAGRTERQNRNEQQQCQSDRRRTSLLRPENRKTPPSALRPIPVQDLKSAGPVTGDIVSNGTGTGKVRVGTNTGTDNARNGNPSGRGTRGPAGNATRPNAIAAVFTPGGAAFDDSSSSQQNLLLDGSGVQSRSTSYVSLNSADDLLGRRMKGLTGALMGEERDLMTP